MKIYVAKEAGFCFGVKRALEIIDRLHEEGQPIQIYGQLIHNKTVLENLKARGIDCIDSLSQLKPKHTLILRTHGIPLELEKNLIKQGVSYVDATCPLVKRIHQIIAAFKPEQTRIVIVGDATHPEIIAARSYAPSAQVINSPTEAHGLEQFHSISVVAQTTLDVEFFEQIVAILEEKTKNLYVHNTICQATRVRQDAIKTLAPTVDAVVVVGGKDSSNTRKLFNIARNKNMSTYHIEKSSDLYQTGFLEKMALHRSVGITAGASTPPEEIQEIKRILKNLNRNNHKESNHGETKRDTGH